MSDPEYDADRVQVRRFVPKFALMSLPFAGLAYAFPRINSWDYDPMLRTLCDVCSVSGYVMAGLCLALATGAGIHSVILARPSGHDAPS